MAMKNTIMKNIIKTTVFALSTAFLCQQAIAEEDKSGIIAAMPWASAISLGEQEFIQDNEITKGETGSVSFTQSIHFNHMLKKYFDMGFYVKGAYLFSGDTQRYWENKTTTSYGIEFIKVFSNDLVSWGRVKLVMGKRNDGHHDPIGKPFNEDLDEINLTISTSGDLLQ